jgi:hypothetical protein
MGRAFRVVKRMAHLTVEVTERPSKTAVGATSARKPRAAKSAAGKSTSARKTTAKKATRTPATSQD